MTTSTLNIAVKTGTARTNVKGLNTELERLDQKGAQASRQATLLSRSIAGIGTAVAGIAVGAGIAGVTQDLAQLQGINSRMINLTGDLAGQQEFLRETAGRLSAEYTTLANGYSRLLPLYKAGILSLQESRDITEGLAQVQAATGASSADLGRSLFGLSQGLSAGTLRAEELNQVTEALPGLLQSLDKAAGVAGGGFRRLVNDGEVTSEFFKNVLQKALLDYSGTAESLSGNITQTFNRTRNSYALAVEAFEQPISFVALAGADALSDAFDLVRENADGIVTSAKVVATATGLMFAGQAAQRAGEFAQKVALNAKNVLDLAEARKVDAAATQASTVAKAENAKLQTGATAAEVKQAEILAAKQAALAATTTATTGLGQAQRVTAGFTAQLTSAIGAGVAANDAYTASTNAATSSLGRLASAQLAARETAVVSNQAGAGAGQLAVLTASSTALESNNRQLAANRVNADASAAARTRNTASVAAGTTALGAQNIALLTHEAATKKSAAATLLNITRMRAAQAGTLALAASTATLNSAMALVGGPVGAAVIATGSLIYFATRSSESERAVEDLKEAVDSLSNSFFNNSTAAQSAADAQIKAAEATAETIRAEILRLQTEIDLDSQFFDGSAIIESYREDLRSVYDEIERIQNISRGQVALAESIQPFDIQFAADAADTFDLVGARAKTASEIIAKLIPDDAKRAQLKQYSSDLAQAFQIGSIDQSQYTRATAAIDEQLAKLNGLGEAQKKAEQQARALQSALESALPDVGAEREYQENLALLEQGLARGGEQADLYRDAIAALSKQFSDDKLTEQFKEFKSVVESRSQTPFSGYAQDIELLNRALTEAPADKIDAINLAIANLDNEIRLEFTSIGEAETVAKASELYQQQLAALNQFHQSRQVDSEAAQADLARLEQDYADQVADINRATRDKLASLGGISTAVQLDFQIADDQVDLKSLLDERVITQDEYERTARELAAKHQEELSELVRSGEATRAQIEQASGFDRLVGLQARYQQEIDIVSDLASQSLGARVDREQREAQAALENAQDLQKIADEKQAAYEKNGTEENRIAAEKAVERAKIAEEAARVEFEQQKKAQLQQARLSQLLAVMNAFATGGNWLTGLGYATVAKLATDRVIDDIKATEFSGTGAGGDVSVNSGASSGSGSGSGAGTTIGGAASQASQQQQQSNVFVVPIVYDADGVVDPSKIEQRQGQILKKLVDENKVNFGPNKPDFSNLTITSGTAR